MCLARNWCLPQRGVLRPLTASQLQIHPGGAHSRIASRRKSQYYYSISNPVRTRILRITSFTCTALRTASNLRYTCGPTGRLNPASSYIEPGYYVPYSFFFLRNGFAWDFFFDEVQTVVNVLVFIAISCNGGQLMFSNPATLL